VGQARGERARARRLSASEKIAGRCSIPRTSEKRTVCEFGRSVRNREDGEKILRLTNLLQKNFGNFTFRARRDSSKQHRGEFEKRGTKSMLFSRTKCVLSILAALALALPLAARAGAAKDKSIARATMQVLTDSSLAGNKVKAGTYDVVANESTLKLMQKGKVVAETPISWKDEQSRSPYSGVVAENGSITEVHFSGKKRFAEPSSGSMSSAGQE
jgi:hypothetical protein